MSLNTSIPPITAGTRFGKWLVLADQQFNFIKTVRCKCDCGTERDVDAGNLRRGHTLSCGCTSKAALAAEGSKRRKHRVEPGDKFTRLTVLDSTKFAAVLCKCDCGNTVTVTANSLYRNATKSCGCYGRELAAALGASRHSQDGMSAHPLYNVWQRLTQRKRPMHEPWRKSLKQFVQDVEAEIGPRPPHTWFRLLDASKPYQPGNVQWGPQYVAPGHRPALTEQERYDVVELIKAGVKQCDIAKEYQVSASTVSGIWRSLKYNP